MKLRKEKWMPKASQVYSKWDQTDEPMPKASQVYSIGVAYNVFDPFGVADIERLYLSTNLVSLRGIKNIGIEI